jgi:hypothetical protein
MGWTNQQFNLLIIVSGSGFSGLFVYSPSIGPGNLLVSDAGSAGTDPYGNAYVQGHAVYGNVTTTSPIVPVQNPPPVFFSSSSGSVTLPNPTTAGNTLTVLIATIGLTTNGTISGVTLGGAAGNFASRKVEGTGTDTAVMSIWSDPGCAGGQTAVACTVTGAVGNQLNFMKVIEWPGTLTFDQSAGGLSNANSATWTTGASGTTTQAVEVVVGAVVVQAAVAGPVITGPASPWVNDTQINSTGTFAGFLSSYETLSATGTVTYNGTVTPNETYCAALATFKATAPSSTHTAKIVESVISGAVRLGFYSGAPSEAGIANITEVVFNSGLANESIGWFISGPEETNSPDFCAVNVYSSAANATNGALGQLWYVSPAGAGSARINWGYLGVSRGTVGGITGGVPLNLMDTFSRTITVATAAPLTRAFTIPALDIVSGIEGTTYQIDAWGSGTWGNPGQTGTITLQIFGLSVSLFPTFAAGLITAGHTFVWQATVWSTVATVGSSGTMNTGGYLTFTDTTQVPPTVAGPYLFNVVGTVINTTAQSSMAILWQWGSATGAPTITCPESIFTRKEP